MTKKGVIYIGELKS